MPKLTKRHVDAAEIQTADYFIWDDDRGGSVIRYSVSVPLGGSPAG